MRSSLLSALALLLFVAAASPALAPASSSSPAQQAGTTKEGTLSKPARPDPERPATSDGVSDGLHVAPQPQTPGAPPESTLNPPANAEKSQQPPGPVTVKNPAFPPPAPAAAEKPQPDLGPAFAIADLQPYFATGTLALAKSEFDAGRYAHARELLETQGSAPQVRYLRALSAERAGDTAFSFQEFFALVKDYPAMADRCLTHAAIAAEDLKQWAQAGELYGQVAAGSKLYVDARFGLARVKRQLKDPAGAMEALGPLAQLPAPSWGRDVGAEALIAIADLAGPAKEAQVQQEALLTLWAKHPLSPLAQVAERRLKGKKIPTEDKVSRGELLVEAHRNTQGMAVLEPLLKQLKLPDPLGCRARFAYGKALRKERSHTKAIDALAPVVEQCKDPDLRARALYVLGSSRSIVDQPHGAAVYERLVKDYPSHPFADDALFFAADLYLRAGDVQTALARLDEISKSYPDGDFLSEALFKKFWILRGQGKTAEALKTLDQIDAQFGKSDESYDLERSTYWRARMLEQGGDKAKAAELLEALATAHPATYYGLIARDRLGALDPKRQQRVMDGLSFPAGTGAWPLHAGALAQDGHFLAGIELLRLGFGDAASPELLAANRGRLSEEPLRLLVEALARSGDPRGAHAIARTALRKDLSGRVTAENRPVWEIAYPNAFRDLIEKHCAAAKVDPDLLQALMREESALDPKALSWAGALGLTQLMPSTANAVARAHKLPRISTQMLLDPDWNIRLGALNLGGLLSRFSGVKQHAVAGYNAGSGPVDRWIGNGNGKWELDEWVEEIPISETRGYVKRVLRSYNTYKLLYAKPAPSMRAEK